MELSGNLPVGASGEKDACRYLESIGHTILERNWRSGHLEIDIISLAPDGLHIVEVKTRVAPLAALPEENVTAAKRRKITSAALKYLHSGRVRADVEIFFDIIAVVYEGGRTTVTYFPQAWIPMYV